MEANKINRTFRIDPNLLEALDQISPNYGDVTRHVETALKGYKPIKCIMKAKPKEALEIPPEINLEAWTEWEAYRRIDKHKTITKAAARKQFKLLSNYSPETQQAIIDSSIQNDYQGLFPPKTQVIKAQPKTSAMTMLTDRSWADHLINTES